MTNYLIKLIPNLKVASFAIGGLLLAQGCGPEFDVEADLSSQGADTELTSLKPDAERTEGAEGDFEITEQALYEDGCSGKVMRFVGSLLTLNVYLLESGKIFKNACVRHDYCYQGGLATYGKSRSNCDDDFYSQMKEECRTAFAKKMCIRAAKKMKWAVSTFGASHYKSELCKTGEIFTSANHKSLDCSAWEPYWGTPTKAPVSCAGTPGQWKGCRGSGCAACTDLLTEYPKYFNNNPYCSPNTTCNGVYGTCNTACPAPTSADR